MKDPEGHNEGSVFCVGETVSGEGVLARPESWRFAESAERALVSESEDCSHDDGRKVAEEEAACANTCTDSAEGNSGAAANGAHIDTHEQEEDSVDDKDSRPL